MNKIYLKYPINYNQDSKGWSTISPIELLTKHLSKYITNNETDANIIFINKHPISYNEIQTLRSITKKTIIIYINDY